MQIRRVKIDGFKNVSKVNLNLDRITALVSLNNYGKSNVLSGIDFGLAFIRASNEDKLNLMSNANLMPINKELFGRNFMFEIETMTSIDDKSYIVEYGYSFSWKTNKDIDPGIVEEHLRIRLNEKGQKYNKFVTREKKNTLYKRTDTGRCSSKLKTDGAELAINKLRAFDELYYADIVQKLNSLRMYVETNLDAKSFYQPDPIIYKDLSEVMVDSHNLPRIIYKLKSDYHDKYELLKNVYMQLFPNVEDIIVQQFKLDKENDATLPEDAPFMLANSYYLLFVKDSNLIHPINFTMMSDGAKRVFMILTKIILAKMSNIALVAIEEPENSVHPSLFRSYINIINQLVDDCRIIITSHSPYIINYLDPLWIRVGANCNHGFAEFYPFKASGKEILTKDAIDFDMTVGDYLFSILSDTDNNLDEYLERGINE